MKTHTVTGGGGTRLHVEETGPEDGPAVVFLHGFSMSGRAYDRLFAGPLAATRRLVRVDLRGHGLSDKPEGAYGDPGLWADDVAAVIAGLELERPILSGWSYGGVVVLDYLRRHGADNVAGIQFVGAVSKLGRPAGPYLGAEFKAAIPALLSEDPAVAGPAFEAFLPMCVADPASLAGADGMMADALSVPAHVRRGMFARSIDNDDLLRQLDLPVLITHGAEDRVILPAMAEHHADLLANARLSMMAGAGHMPFHEAQEAFTRDLQGFAADCR